jgi:predicted peptidase
LYVPPSYDGRELFPLIVFLHGFSDRGSDGRGHTKVGLAPAIRRAEKSSQAFNYLALFPQSQSGSWWAGSADGELVMKEIAAVEKKYAVDPSRIYLTGHSSGGIGTWNLAQEYPARWAAIVPVAADAYPPGAASVSHIPCWCFHGSADRVFPVERARQMVQALKDAGGQPRYTEYPRLDHNIWRSVYVMPELYEWLAQQRLRPRS